MPQWKVDRGYEGAMTKRRLRLSRRFWILAVIAPLCVLIAVPFGAGAFTAAGLVYAPCGGSDELPSDAYQWVAFTLSARDGGEFDGYFVQGSNGATIIFPPNYTAGRGSRLFEALPLVDAGYNVVVFESRRCAGMGPLSLGYKEVDEVADVLDYLATRVDVEQDRIGIHGFSSAGATAIMAAAKYPQLKAVVAVGNYADMNDILEENSGGMTPALVGLFRDGLKVSYRMLIGSSIEKLSPISVIDQIAPRPILLIYGTEEPGVHTSDDLQAHAGENAELWIIEGEGHGGYRDRDDYSARAIAFFDHYLLSSPH